jgi:hypothetical protein
MMTATQDFETILTSRDLPAEFLRVASSSHQGDEPKVACMLSGMVATRQQDEVICPLMLRRNLLVPAHQGIVAQSAWHVA